MLWSRRWRLPMPRKMLCSVRVRQHHSRRLRKTLTTCALHIGLDEDLACSATKTVSEKIQKAFSKNFRANKKARGAEKESMAREAFGAARWLCSS